MTSLFQAPTRNGLQQLRDQIKSRGLTREQASAKYGLQPDMMDWLGKQGISFAPQGPGAAPQGAFPPQAAIPLGGGGPNPPAMSSPPAMAAPQMAPDAMPQPRPVPVPGASAMAAQGRNGDTSLAHVTPGETVIPAAVGATRPDLVQGVHQEIAQRGGDPSKYTVGAGRRNPKTGIEEFAFPEAAPNYDEQINALYASVGKTPDMIDQQGRDFWTAKLQAGEDISGAFTDSAKTVYTNTLGGQASPYTTQNQEGLNNLIGGQGGTNLNTNLQQQFRETVTGVSPATPSVIPGNTGVPGTSGASLTNVPTATQAVGPSLMTATAAPVANVVAPVGQARGYQAATATGAVPVTAGQGTVGNYSASTVNPSSLQQVTAGQAQASLAGPAHTYTGAQGAASLWDVDRSQTVQGQIDDIIAANSPLQQRAEAKSLQEMNARGLANSSMAVQAGQAALYDAALPIAQQDANTFAQRGQFNAGNKQQMTLANMGSSNDANRFNAGARNESEQFNAQLSTQNSQFNVSKALEAGIVNAQQAAEMAQLNAQMVNRAAEFNITTDAQMQQFNLDQALKAGIINQEQANKLSAFNATSQNAANEFTASQSNQMTMDNSKNALAASLANQAAAERLGQFNASEANKLSGLSASLQNDINKFNASESNDLTAMGMDSETKKELANIEASYKMLMQTSASGAEVYKTMISGMTTILSNDTMNEAAKKTAIGNLVSALNGALATVGDISNLDLPELDFGTVATQPDSAVQDDAGVPGGSGYNMPGSGPGNGSNGDAGGPSGGSVGGGGIGGGISA